jgi:hypothetical protein
MLRLKRREMETGLKNYRAIPRPYLMELANGVVYDAAEAIDSCITA